MRRLTAGLLLAAVTAAACGGVALNSSASTPASGRIDRLVAAGDTWTRIANELAPAASAADRSTFARLLVCRNAVDLNCQNDSLTVALPAGWIISYLPGDVPAPAPATTTTVAATTTGATTSTSTSTTTTTVAPTTTATAATTTTATTSPSSTSSAPTTTATTMPGQIPLDQLPTGNAGSPNILIGPTNQQGGSGDGSGNFRNYCDYSHMNYDDPIVYPGQQGAAHLHSFFGNTGVNYLSTSESLKTTGNGTCSGGIANRSAYWVPSLLDANGVPQKPLYSLIYYKNGEALASSVKEIPNGLRIVAGNAKATTGQTDDIARFMGNCAWGPYLSGCQTGQDVWMSISFPQCWNGRDLDSSDHQSHMAYAPWPMKGCPATHPVVLPQLEVNVFWKAPPGAPSAWKLASDVMVPGAQGGQTMHADFIEGWDDDILSTWTQECIVEERDCTRGLGNATMLLDPPNFDYET